MAQQTINPGDPTEDGTSAAGKLNENFTELYGSGSVAAVSVSGVAAADLTGPDVRRMFYSFSATISDETGTGIITFSAKKAGSTISEPVLLANGEPIKIDLSTGGVRVIDFSLTLLDELVGTSSVVADSFTMTVTGG